MIGDNFTREYFSTNSQEIIDIVLEEYSTGVEPTAIVFEGVEEEYNVIDEICFATPCVNTNLMLSMDLPLSIKTRSFLKSALRILFFNLMNVAEYMNKHGLTDEMLDELAA